MKGLKQIGRGTTHKYKWQIRVKFGTDDIRRVFEADSKKDAEAIAADIRAKITKAKALGQNWTVVEELRKERNPLGLTEAAARFLDGAKAENQKPESMRAYRSILTKHIIPHFGDTPVRDINKAALLAFRVELQTKKRGCGKYETDKPLSNVTLNQIVTILRMILLQCEREDDIFKAPWIKPLEEDKPEVAPFTLEELWSVFNCLSKEWRPFFAVLCFTGMRPSELFGLRWRDIDFAQGFIRIRRARVRGIEGTPKTKHSQRDLLILKVVADALRELKSGTVASIDDFVIVNQKAYQKYISVWTAALKRAGIPHRRAYQLRHTFASSSIRGGAEATYVTGALGHTDSQITFERYIRYISDSNKENEQRIASSFAQFDTLFDNAKMPPKLNRESG